MSAANAFDTFRQLWELTWWLGRDDEEVEQLREDLETLLFISPLLPLSPQEDLSTIWRWLGDVDLQRHIEESRLQSYCYSAADLLRRTRTAEITVRESKPKRKTRRRVDPDDIYAQSLFEAEEEPSTITDKAPLPPKRDLALKVIVGNEAINLGLAPDQLFFCLGFHWLDPEQSPPTGDQLVKRLGGRFRRLLNTSHRAMVQPLLWHVSWDSDETLGQIRIISLRGRFPEDMQRFSTFVLQPTNDSERLRIFAQLEGLSVALWLYPGVGIAKGHAMVFNPSGPPDAPMKMLETLIEGELSRALRFEELRLTIPFERPPPSPTKK